MFRQSSKDDMQAAHAQYVHGHFSTARWLDDAADKRQRIKRRRAARENKVVIVTFHLSNRGVAYALADAHSFNVHQHID